jgi:hypothetical protein
MYICIDEWQVVHYVTSSINYCIRDWQATVVVLMRLHKISNEKMMTIRLSSSFSLRQAYRLLFYIYMFQISNMLMTFQW